MVAILILRARRGVRAFAIGALCPSAVGLALAAVAVFRLGWGPGFIDVAKYELNRTGDWLRIRVSVVWLVFVVSGLLSLVASRLLANSGNTGD